MSLWRSLRGLGRVLHSGGNQTQLPSLLHPTPTSPPFWRRGWIDLGSTTPFHQLTSTPPPPPLLTRLVSGVGVPLSRTVVKFSMGKGKRMTEKSVVHRFFRLHWGAWIRPRAGRGHGLWKKRPNKRKALRKHIFCSSTQSYKFDKMVTKFWRRKTFYVDDPYASYHKRDTFPLTKGI